MNIHVVTHLIFGLPNETEQDMLNSVKFVVDAKTDGIKIALLHVLEGTDLAIDYKNNAFSCLEMEEYFKSINCEYVLVDVFAYNKIGIDFYNKNGYHHRMYTDIKKL